MRRVLALLVGFALVGLLAAPATATSGYHARYQTQWVNAFWHSRVRLDQSTYLKLVWYAGAYDSGDEGFFSDLYRSVYRCETTAGRDRCRYLRGRSWYGYTGRNSNNTFTLDRRLTQAHLDATYRLYRYRHSGRELVGRFHVVADVTGRGDIERGRDTYSSHEGCTMYRYSGRYIYRDATATGTLARGDQTARNLGATRDANFGANQTVEIDHTC